MLFHALAATWVILVLAWARRAPDAYAAAMQEDRLVEWSTVMLFLTAAVVRGRCAARERSVFDGLVALFCLFVAGEEISWGQRLIGLTPPVPFLAGNTQQELNIHNFADIFGRPKWALVGALGAFGILLPLAMRIQGVRTLGRRVGVTPPALAWMPWFAIAIALLVWYPVDFTGEWVECLVGALFLASAGIGGRSLALSVGVAAAAGAMLMRVNDRPSPEDPLLTACAERDLKLLAEELNAGRAVGRRLENAGSVHKRMYTASVEGYLSFGALSAFALHECPAASSTLDTRSRYLIDPWGVAYWIDTGPPRRGSRRVVLYSFGPNRRRDGDSGDTGPGRGDDITVLAELRVP